MEAGATKAEGTPAPVSGMTPDTAINAWLAQGAQMWSRMKTVSAIEAGALASAWYLIRDANNQPRAEQAAVLVIALAALLLLVVAWLTRRDGMYMNALQKYDKAFFDSVEKPFCSWASGRHIAMALPIFLAAANFLIFLI